jgi:hypothetical protein
MSGMVAALWSPITQAAAQAPQAAQAPPHPSRPAPPTRDPSTPGYVEAKDLPDGVNAPANADGNFILGPTHNPAPEMASQEGVPQGTVYEFTISSADSKIFPIHLAHSIPRIPPNSSLPPATPLPTLATLLFTSPNNMCQAPSRPSSSAPMDLTGRCLRLSIT